MMIPKEGERRQFPRYHTRVAVFHREDMKDLTGVPGCHTRDVSEGGLAIEVENYSPEWLQSLEPGKTMFSLEFSLPGFSGSIHAASRLIWKQETFNPRTEARFSTLGVEFMSIRRDDRQKLEQYVKRNVRSQNPSAGPAGG